MTPDYFIILAVIAVFSVVQSLFGMGVLVFGTPTLLLLGYDFITALGFLLPASFAISLLQVLGAGAVRAPVSRYLYVLCLPGIAVGLWMAEFSTLASSINILIGGTLMISALVRLFPAAQKVLARLLQRHSPAYHLMMGALHGLTNLGGALLAILASETSTGKQAIRYTIAHYYLAFSAVQMLVLAVLMGHPRMLAANIPLAVVSAGVYLLIGNRLFFRTSGPAYHTALTLFMAAYGVVILFKF